MIHKPTLEMVTSRLSRPFSWIQLDSSVQFQFPAGYSQSYSKGLGGSPAWKCSSSSKWMYDEYIYIYMWYITVVTGILSQCKLSIYTVHPFLPLKKGRPLEMGWSIRPSMVGEWDGDYGIGFTTWMGLVINWICSYTIHILHHSIFHDNLSSG